MLKVDKNVAYDLWGILRVKLVDSCHHHICGFVSTHQGEIFFSVFLFSFVMLLLGLFLRKRKRRNGGSGGDWRVWVVSGEWWLVRVFSFLFLLLTAGTRNNSVSLCDVLLVPLDTVHNTLFHGFTLALSLSLSSKRLSFSLSYVWRVTELERERTVYIAFSSDPVFKFELWRIIINTTLSNCMLHITQPRGEILECIKYNVNCVHN